MPVDIVTENAKTVGRTARANILVDGHGDVSVAGFARSISYAPGDTVQFCVTGEATTIDIYRSGWYGGDGFRQWGTVTNTPTVQPEATVIPGSNGATTCTHWSVTATWDIPADAVSGIYLAFIRSPGSGFWVTFVVRDDNAQADIIYKTSDSTWAAAYNHYGTPANIDGKNVYGEGTGVGNIYDRAMCVSYHRPIITRGTVPQTMWQACEMPMIRWLERMGYTIKYITSVDLDTTPGILDSGKIFLSSGHDEYWSLNMRRNAESYRDRGAGHSIYSSGNEVFWKTRHDYVGDECVMWCRKETMPGPVNVGHEAGTFFTGFEDEWLGTWKDTRWPDREPENLLTGTDFRMNGVNDLTATVAPEYGDHPAWRGTTLAAGTAATFFRVIGFEADSMLPDRPEPNVAVLAGYTADIAWLYADDNGQFYNGFGMLDWGIVAQGYDSGSVTVGFGTCQWGWALDGEHDRYEGTPTSAVAQQFTANLLTDLGAVAATPMSGVALTAPAGLEAYGVGAGGWLGGGWVRGDGAALQARSYTGDPLTVTTLNP